VRKVDLLSGIGTIGIPLGRAGEELACASLIFFETIVSDDSNYDISRCTCFCKAATVIGPGIPGDPDDPIEAGDAEELEELIVD